MLINMHSAPRSGAIAMAIGVVAIASVHTSQAQSSSLFLDTPEYQQPQRDEFRDPAAGLHQYSVFSIAPFFSRQGSHFWTKRTTRLTFSLSNSRGEK